MRVIFSVRPKQFCAQSKMMPMTTSSRTSLLRLTEKVELMEEEAMEVDEMVVRV